MLDMYLLISEREIREKWESDWLVRGGFADPGSGVAGQGVASLL